MELAELVGRRVLSGIETGVIENPNYFDPCDEPTCNYVKFTLDGTHYMAIEDPDDGYRSYLNELKISDTPCRYSLPDVEVVCSMRPDGKYETNDVLVFVDVANGKEVLAIGTRNTDDYYPYCVLEYTPENLSCNSCLNRWGISI